MKRYYISCPLCGAHLDPGERCEDCLGPVEIVKERRTSPWVSDRATCPTASD